MLRRMFPIVVLGFLSGCGQGVAWRADSTGFLYTDQEGKRVMAFDLKTKTSSVVVPSTGTVTALPGLSPDGKRVAVARLEYAKGKRPRLQVRIYSITGKEEKRSAWFERAREDESKEDKVQVVHLHWATPDRIGLIAAGACIYDLKNDKLSEVDNVEPWFPGASVIRPDGKGCLAHREVNDDLELLFVDWNGKAQVVGKLAKGEERSPTFLAEWEGTVALVVHDGAIYEADTSRGTLLPSQKKPPALPAAGKLVSYHVFPGRTKALCVYEHEEEMGMSKESWMSVEVQDLTTSTRTALVKKCELFPMLHPSPDRKTVVLAYSTKGGARENHLLVVGADGKVVSDIKLGS